MFTLLFFIIFIINRSAATYNSCCPGSVLKDNNATFCESGNVINLSCIENDTEIVYDLIKYENEISKCPLKDIKICSSEILTVKDTFVNVSVVCKTDLKKCIKSEKWWDRFVAREKVVNISYQVVKLLSVIFLIITSITYVMISRLNDVHGTCLRHYSITLAIAYITIVIENSYNDSDSSLICILHVYSIIYFIIASFSWLNLTFYTTWKSVKNKEFNNQSYDKRRDIAYCAMGYAIIPGIAILASYIAVLIRHRNDHTTSPCLKHQLILIGFIYIPILMTLLVNALYFVDTSRRLRSDQNEVVRDTKLKFKYWLNFKLFTVVSLTWVIYGFSGFLNIKSLWINILLNVLFSSLGIVIFFLLVVLRKNVLQDLSERMGNLGTRIFQTPPVNETVNS